MSKNSTKSGHRFQPLANRLLPIAYCLLLIANCQLVSAQDIHFSQFTMNPLQLDPSQAGKFGGDQRAVIIYRSQWSSIINNPFRTYGASFDMDINTEKDNFFGVGITAYRDKAGEIALGTTIFNATIAYHVKINMESFLSAGIQLGVLQNSLDPSSLRFDSQFDGSGHNAMINSGENFQETSLLNPDFAAGVSYNWETNTRAKVISNNGYDGQKINVGIAVHHVSNPNYSFLESQADRLFLKYILHANTSFGIGGTNMAVQPSGFIQYQENAIDFVLGSFIRYNLKESSKYTKFSNGAALSLGLHYRMADAFIPSVLIETGSFAFGLSYDINLSGLSVATTGRGGFEISVRYINPNPFGERKSQARFF